jgi:hypothetical protein
MSTRFVLFETLTIRVSFAKELPRRLSVIGLKRVYSFRSRLISFECLDTRVDYININFSTERLTDLSETAKAYLST